jgi:hypothetical protein
MSHVTYFSAEELFPRVIPKLKEVDIVLDIGPGIQPQKFIVPAVHICCEPFGQYVEKVQQITETADDRQYIIIQATWAEAMKIFPPKSVDAIYLLDVIEHLDKKESTELLKQAEKIARKQVVIFTPLGFIEQYHPTGKDAWGLDGVAWQEHKSGWMPEDFDDSWECLVAKEFHNADDLHHTSCGAFWAIKTFKGDNYHRNIKLTTRRRMHQRFDKFIDLGVKVMHMLGK